MVVIGKAQFAAILRAGGLLGSALA